MCPAGLRVAGGARAERWKLSHSPSSATKDAGPVHVISCLAAAARGRYLLDLLAQFPDPRKRCAEDRDAGSAAVVEGYLVAVGVGERERADARAVGGGWGGRRGCAGGG